MKSMMIPICFSNTNNVSNTHPQPPPPPMPSPQSPPPSPAQQNLITCIYQAQLYKTGPIFLTFSWSKTPSSHTLTIHSSPPDTSSTFHINTTISLFSSSLSSFFRPRSAGSGSKSLHHSTSDSNTKLKLYWDFTQARFSHSNSAEPDSGFYIALVGDGRVEFFLGDSTDEFARRVGSAVGLRSSPEPVLLSRREHVFGRRNYASRLQFSGSKHDVEIECSGGALRVRIDGEIRVVVKHLAWKFRGNERIFIGGIEVEFYWDVFNWVSDCGGGHGVFVFQVGDGGVWPEMAGPEKKLIRKSMSSIGSSAAAAVGAPGLVVPSPSASCSSSVLQWAEESSDCGRSSCSSSTRSSGSGGGFSLVLYAWRRN